MGLGALAEVWGSRPGLRHAAGDTRCATFPPHTAVGHVLVRAPQRRREAEFNTSSSDRRGLGNNAWPARACFSPRLLILQMWWEGAALAPLASRSSSPGASCACAPGCVQEPARRPRLQAGGVPVAVSSPGSG